MISILMFVMMVLDTSVEHFGIIGVSNKEQKEIGSIYLKLEHTTPGGVLFRQSTQR